MPKYDPPRSDRDRLAFLKRTAVTGPQDIEAGNHYVSQETLDAINAFLPDFEKAVNAVSQKLGARVKEVSERNAAIERVATYVRDLWAVLKRRADRLDEPAGVLVYYQLPLDGTVPNSVTQEQWLGLAAQVVKGDADAVAAGYLAMENPSAAELEAVLKMAQSESNDVSIADRDYDEAQERAAALRPRADELIAEVMAELRFNLRKKDAPSQRRTMRRYGAKFKYLRGEPRDADDVAQGADIPVPEEEASTEAG